MVAVTAAEVVVLVIIIIEVAVMGQMAVEEEEEEGLVPRIPDFPRFKDGERLKKNNFLHHESSNDSIF